MNEEFYRRQAEINQEQERHKVAQQKHSTLETYNLEQQEAHAGVRTRNAVGATAVASSRSARPSARSTRVALGESWMPAPVSSSRSACPLVRICPWPS